MMNENDDTSSGIVIEKVPLPEIRPYRKMQEEVVRALMALAPGESFFVATIDEDDTQRQIGALRQKIGRLKKKEPNKRFTVRKDERINAGQIESGYRVYRIPRSEYENHQPS